jgi:hypothetical protein
MVPPWKIQRHRLPLGIESQHLLVLFVCLLGTVWCTAYLFACVASFRSLPLGAKDFGNLQELGVHDFEQQLAREQGK